MDCSYKKGANKVTVKKTNLSATRHVPVVIPLTVCRLPMPNNPWKTQTNIDRAHKGKKPHISAINRVHSSLMMMNVESSSISDKIDETTPHLTDDIKVIRLRKKFASYEWSNIENVMCFHSSGLPIPNSFSSRIIHVDDWHVVDADDNSQGLVVHGQVSRRKKGGGEFVVAKLPKNMCGDVEATFVDDFLPNVSTLLKSKNDVKRSASRSGVSDRYVSFGYRKNPLDNQVGEYAFKQTSSTSVINSDINKRAARLCNRLEEAASNFGMILPGYEEFCALKNIFQLPTFGENDCCHATQFSIGKNYWSPSHTDNDMFHSVLSVSGPSDKDIDSDTVIYYFVFPHYKLLIPLTKYDVIIFNPLVHHCCTNPFVEDSLIYSAYVSKKTVATHISSTIK